MTDSNRMQSVVHFQLCILLRAYVECFVFFNCDILVLTAVHYVGSLYCTLCMDSEHIAEFADFSFFYFESVYG